MGLLDDMRNETNEERAQRWAREHACRIISEQMYKKYIADSIAGAGASRVFECCPMCDGKGVIHTLAEENE